ncbi:MAG TPA: DMT family transporter [Puia sp.]|nr:DMT family transporter [Puia sp.]
MKKAFWQLHLAVFIAGFTGILGRLITLNEGLLVWYRLLITSVSLWVLCFLPNYIVRISMKDALRIAGVGAIAALHWVCFYGSIKSANVSVALICFSAIGFFTALLEPLIFRSKTDVIELLLGLLVIAGIYLVFRFDPHYKKGIIIGLISALLGSIFPILNRRLLQRVPVKTLTVYQLSGGFVFLTLLLPFYLSYFPEVHFFPSLSDWIWLIVLSWVCTIFAFTLSMSALQKISAFTVNLTYNLEPVYGIALAFLVFREEKSFGYEFYIGLFLIILSIALQMMRLWKKHENNSQNINSN